MVNIPKLFHHFRPIKALVVGDFMLDKYTSGSVGRISPEAPVAILHVKEEKILPGGAGNVILNFLALQAKTIALGRIGKDQEGQELKDLLAKRGADVSFLFEEELFRTPLKNRLLADRQQLVRVDFEDVRPLSEALEEQIIQKLPALISQVEIVAISDYGKGFLSSKLLSAIITIAQEQSIPVVVDPKGKDFSKYRGATIIKPNLSEAYAASSLAASAPLSEVADTLLKITEARHLLITRSQDGMSLFDQKREKKDFPVISKEVRDVTGAGDTVLATLSVLLACGHTIEQAIQLANIAAGIAIEHVGCVSVTLFDIMQKLLKLDGKNKIFEEKDLFAIQELFQKEKFTLLVVDGKEGMSTKLFSAIRTLSLQDSLALYIKKPFDEELIFLLSSLSEVDLIILEQDGVAGLCKKIRLQEVFQIIEKKLQPVAMATGK